MGLSDLAAFADEVGPSGPVTCVGGRTHWDVGGRPDSDARDVKAPAGVVEYQPAEMIVRCGAGTTVAELDAAVAEGGQMCLLDPPDPVRATVGGVLAVGRSGLRRLRYGPVRDVLLEARYVSADGVVVKAGGPVVKNVTGFDLCRLLVGSLGTLGLLGQVVLRCRPRPAVARWFAGQLDPFAVRRRLCAPSSILWDGVTTWVLLEGHLTDVAAEAKVLAGLAGSGLAEVEGPPPLPTGGRRSLRPSELTALGAGGGGAALAGGGTDGRSGVGVGPFVAEVGVGVVHVSEPPVPPPVPPEVATLNQTLKERFDPTGRLNPGRTVLGG